MEEHRMLIDSVKIYIVALLIFTLSLSYLTWSLISIEPFRLIIGVILGILAFYLFLIGRDEYILEK
jgi:hypothetical protein